MKFADFKFIVFASADIQMREFAKQLALEFLRPLVVVSAGLACETSSRLRLALKSPLFSPRGLVTVSV